MRLPSLEATPLVSAHPEAHGLPRRGGEAVALDGKPERKSSVPGSGEQCELRAGVIARRKHSDAVHTGATDSFCAESVSSLHVVQQLLRALRDQKKMPLGMVHRKIIPSHASSSHSPPFTSAYGRCCVGGVMHDLFARDTKVTAQ